MIPFCQKGDSGVKPRGARSKMCRESRQHSTSMTNFPPIADYSRLTSPGAQRREDRARREPPRPIAGGFGPRPRSNSDHSLGDVWSSSRRSICSSNGRSSQSLSSGDASTVSTERLWRRRKLSPRRVASRPVAPPLPAEDAPGTPAAEADRGPRIHNSPSPPATSGQAAQTDQPRGGTRFGSSQKHQPRRAEEPGPGDTSSLSRAMRKAESCCLVRKPHPPSQQHQEADATAARERRRRKSMPEIYGRSKGEGRKADAAGKKTESRGLGEIMDRVTRERIMNWLSEVAYAKDASKVVLPDELSCIDEE